MNKKDHPLYEIWRSMIKRCTIVGRKDYKWYGGRGIVICDMWINNFWNFVEDMYPTYREGLTIDRVNNDGDYTPENCEWRTWDQQLHNQRKAEITKRSSTKIKGINRAGDRFIVRKSIKGVRIHLGYVDTIEEGIKLLEKNGYAIT